MSGQVQNLAADDCSYGTSYTPVCVRTIYNALTSIKSYIFDRHSLIITHSICHCSVSYNLLCIIPENCSVSIVSNYPKIQFCYR